MYLEHVEDRLLK